MKDKSQVNWSVNWTGVVAGMIGVLAMWVYSIIYVTTRDGVLHDDWLHALGVLLFMAALVIAWHCLALLARAVRWRVLYRQSRVHLGRGPERQ